MVDTKTNSSTPNLTNKENSREAFLALPSIAKCPQCNGIGNFHLKGKENSGHQVVQCRGCRTTHSRDNLRALIASAKPTKRPTFKQNKAKKSSASAASVPDFTAEDFLRLKN